MTGQKKDQDKTALKSQPEENSSTEEKNKTAPEPSYEGAEQEEIEYINLEREEEGKGGEVKVKAAEPDEAEKTIEKLKLELEAREQELEQLRKTVDELRDKFLRSLAELDNVRKRVEKEKEDYYQYALTNFMQEMLPIIDNFERALKMSDESDGKTLKEGVELIYRLLIKLLDRYGVKPIEIGDKKFDPNLHHALSSEESDDVEDVEIVEELQKGYLINNRLLRPSMVRVKVPKKK